MMCKTPSANRKNYRDASYVSLFSNIKYYFNCNFSVGLLKKPTFNLICTVLVVTC